MTQSVDKLTAYWWYEKNFGDALNPFLLERLSGKHVVYTPAAHKPNFRKEWKRFLMSPKEYDFRRLKWPEVKKPVVLAVGSRLEDSRPNYKVWGTGFLTPQGTCKGGIFFAVRGKWSASRLVELGFPECEVYGDPALLLPLIYKASPPILIPEHSSSHARVFSPKKGSMKKIRIGIVPHMIDLHHPVVEEVRQKFPDEILVVDLVHYEKWTDVIDQICSCEVILSSSLHGLIVSDAYQVPNCWIELSGKLSGGHFKFHDYFSSVDRHSEKPVVITCIQQLEECVNLTKCANRTTIQQVQQSLLDVAPFPIKI